MSALFSMLSEIFFNEPQKFTGGTPVPQRGQKNDKEEEAIVLRKVVNLSYPAENRTSHLCHKLKLNSTVPNPGQQLW